MISRRFSVLLAVRFLVVGASVAASFWLVLQPGMHGASLLALSVVAISAVELWWFLSRTNRDIARFLDAARHADYSQRFGFEGVGTGYPELGAAFTDILDRMYEQRSVLETEVRRLGALIDHVPVPLLTVHADGTLVLNNNAARRLFGATDVAHLDDLAAFGTGFRDSVAGAVPGRRELVEFRIGDVVYQLALAATEVIVGGATFRLVSLQDIQSELDLTQAEAWQDLVRVLTHEIMNSITPITSLAATARDLVDEMRDPQEGAAFDAQDLTDLRDAVATVARRADGLLQFVHGYRQLTRLSPPRTARLRVRELFDAVERLMHAEWPEGTPHLRTRVEPAGLELEADRDLLEPVLLNLLRNARQATEEARSREIELLASFNPRGHVVIEVSDNGPGVPADRASQIFVPFYTTRKEGSGVGLALARQVMTAHGGFIRVGASSLGGARFTLTFG